MVKHRYATGSERPRRLLRRAVSGGMRPSRILLWFASLAINMGAQLIRAFLPVLVSVAVLRLVSPSTFHYLLYKLYAHPDWCMLALWALWLRYFWGPLTEGAKEVAGLTRSAAFGLLEKAATAKAVPVESKFGAPRCGSLAGR